MTSFGLNKNIIVNNLNVEVEFLLQRMIQTVVRVVNESNETFNEVVENFRENSFSFIINNTISENIESLFDSYDLVTDVPLNRYNLEKELFGISDNKTLIINNQDLKDALDTFLLNLEIQALIKAYNASATIPFENTDELKQVIFELETQFVKVTNSDIDSDTRTSLLNLKTNTVTLFSQLDIRTIIDKKTRIIPSTVLSYSLYKDSTQSNTIVELNEIVNTGFIEDDIRVVREL